MHFIYAYSVRAQPQTSTTMFMILLYYFLIVDLFYLFKFSYCLSDL